AAGLIALEESPSRLQDDHANAQFLAQRLAQVPGIVIDAETVRTNIVIFDISKLGLDTSAFSQQLKSRGVLANGIDPTHMRMVTHMDVSRADCQLAAEMCKNSVHALHSVL
ncbi:MAG: low specificity L-threonine aldolase, partial [Acidobacteriota bacterium]|nr:low specificity L-threonine aldolase [Acidobacteriota bacterium]